MRRPGRSGRLAAAVGVFAVIFSGACSDKDPTSCAAVAGHVISLMRSELAKDSNAVRLKQAQANLPPLQNALIQVCEEKKWDQKTRRCIARAKSARATGECEPVLQSPGAAGAESAATANQSR